MINGVENDIKSLNAYSDIDTNIDTNNVTNMTIKQNGNIGINNIAPAYSLDVVGNVNVDGIITIGLAL